MKFVIALLAAVPGPAPLTKTTSSIIGDAVLVIGLGLLLLVILLFWAAQVRSPRRRRHRRSGGRKVYAEVTPPAAEDENPNVVRRRYKYRYRRRDHRSRNPTLAELGGQGPLPGDPQQNGSES